MYVFVGISKDAVEKVFDDNAQIDEIDELIAPVVEVSKPVLERDRSRLEENLRTYLICCNKQDRSRTVKQMTVNKLTPRH